MASGRRILAEAAAIVDDLDLDLVVAHAQPHLDAGGVGVAGDVGQALLDHAQDGEPERVGHLLAERFDRAIDANVAVMAGPQRAVALDRLLDADLAVRAAAAQALQDGVDAVLHLRRHRQDGLRAAVDAGLRGGALDDGAGDRAHCGDALAEFVVEFACDRAPLLLEPGLQRARQGLVLLEAGVLGEALVEAVGEAVVAAREERELAGGVFGQALVEAAAGAALERGVDLGDRGQRTVDREAGGEPDRQQQRERPAERGADVVPGVEHGARGVGGEHDGKAVGLEPALGDFRRHPAGEPRRGVAARLVGRFGRHVKALAVGREHFEPVGADAADRAQVVHQALACLRAVGQGFRHQHLEPLLGDAGGGFHLFVNRQAGLAQPNAGTDQHHDRDQGGQHQAQAPMQAGRTEDVHAAALLRLARAEKSVPRWSRSAKGWRRPSAA